MWAHHQHQPYTHLPKIVPHVLHRHCRRLSRGSRNRRRRDDDGVIQNSDFQEAIRQIGNCQKYME